MPSRVLQRPMRAQRAVGRYSAKLCPQGTAIDDVDVPIYPLLGVTRNTQLFF